MCYSSSKGMHYALSVKRHAGLINALVQTSMYPKCVLVGQFPVTQAQAPLRSYWPTIALRPFLKEHLLLKYYVYLHSNNFVLMRLRQYR